MRVVSGEGEVLVGDQVQRHKAQSGEGHFLRYNPDILKDLLTGAIIAISNNL
jgi:hypothetical protein